MWKVRRVSKEEGYFMGISRISLCSGKDVAVIGGKTQRYKLFENLRSVAKKIYLISDLAYCEIDDY